MKRSAFLFLFVLMSVGDMTALNLNIRWLEIFTKPLIVLSLIGYYLSQASPRSMIFVLALACCCLGDTLLLFDSASNDFMVYGLCAFLTAQGLFIFSYRRFSFKKHTAESRHTHKARIAFPIILCGTGLCVILYPKLGALKIPVLIYSLLLTGMVVSAVFRMRLTNSKSFWLVLCGALLFMLSDSVLAINKFFTPIEHASFWIMLTYCSAQFLIVTGILKHPQEPNIRKTG